MPRAGARALLWAAILTATLAGCGDEGATEDACARASCGEHGRCVVRGGVAACECAEGFHAEGLGCIPEAGTSAGPGVGAVPDRPPPSKSPSRVVCTGGTVASPLSEGHCCWPEQEWSASRERCVGQPSCPAGRYPDGEECVEPACIEGQVSGAETGWRCCWPGQRWSAEGEGRCVGEPSCPEGFEVDGEVCARRLRAPGPWVELPPGTFTMGSAPDEEGRSGGETPHAVRLTNGLLVQATEVTRSSFREAMGYDPSEHAHCGGSCPVENVSWHEAAAYANALSRMERVEPCYRCSGRGPRVRCRPTKQHLVAYGCPGYRLPTEAEWEYAARAGTAEARPGPLDEVAWHGGNSGETTHSVGQKAPNAWGLHDMLGNVWEWCHDVPTQYSARPETNPHGPTDVEGLRAFRGGSWVNSPKRTRLAERGAAVPTFRGGTLGLRIVKTVPSADGEPPPAEPAPDVQPPEPDEEPGDETIPGQWVTIEPGTFLMGSPADEGGRGDDEARHRVRLTRRFEMQATEVTQLDFEEVMGYLEAHFENCGPSCPVETVSWHEAAAYCNALSKRAGLSTCYACVGEGGPWVQCRPDRKAGRRPQRCAGYRLPTEAEWEYAARAGTKAATYGELDRIAWNRDTGGDLPHPVGDLEPNAWGLFDMLGNVAEWCHDWLAPYGRGAATDPAGPAEGTHRVVRGGAWRLSPATTRAASRDGGEPGFRVPEVGFRPCRTLPRGR